MSEKNSKDQDTRLITIFICGRWCHYFCTFASDNHLPSYTVYKFVFHVVFSAAFWKENNIFLPRGRIQDAFTRLTCDDTLRTHGVNLRRTWKEGWHHELIPLVSTNHRWTFSTANKGNAKRKKKLKRFVIDSHLDQSLVWYPKSKDGREDEQSDDESEAVAVVAQIRVAAPDEGIAVLFAALFASSTTASVPLMSVISDHLVLNLQGRHQQVSLTVPGRYLHWKISFCVHAHTNGIPLQPSSLKKAQTKAEFWCHLQSTCLLHRIPQRRWCFYRSF